MDVRCCLLGAITLILWQLTGTIHVQQTPASLIGRSGDKFQITCEHDENSYQYMYWYQQAKGQQGLELLGFLSFESINQDPKYQGKFNLLGNAREKGSLEISSLAAETGATYFCAVSQHSVGEHAVSLQKTHQETAVNTCVGISLCNFV